MQVFSSVAQAVTSGRFKQSAVCLGNFDGVHLGHQALFAQAAQQGMATAMTFEPHPGKVLQPTLAPRLIATPARKLQLLEAHGITALLQQPFDRDFAATTPQAFEAMLFDALQVRAVVVGTDYTYGSKRAGRVETLTAAAKARGAQVVVVPPVTLDGVVVSSSRIREYVLEGRVEAANRLLGHPYELEGPVVHGAGRGRTIGIPTANIEVINELRPAIGVYAVRLFHDGVWRGGAANIGAKPTFGANEVTVEVHVLDFSADLYGRTVRVQFVKRLREERRFASVDALKAQLATDLADARAAVQA